MSLRLSYMVKKHSSYCSYRGFGTSWNHFQIKKESEKKTKNKKLKNKKELRENGKETNSLRLLTLGLLSFVQFNSAC